jgi:hypothetical protein
MTLASDTWPNLSIEDYPLSAVRLTTLQHQRVTYLLFGYVELLPKEIPPPESYSEKKNFFDDITVLTSLSVLPLASALVWYEQALSGNLVVPNIDRHVSIQTVQLGPEPPLGHLIAASDPPVQVFWHNVPRMHRLVPMEELPAPIAMLLNQPEQSERRQKVRDWLQHFCFIDLTAFPDCAGGIVLLAPNPVLRCWNYGPSRRLDNGQEIVSVRAIPREGYDFTSLTIRLHEFRLDGRFLITPVPIDAFGQGEIIMPHSVSELALELSCTERGLLSVTNPVGFFNSISFGTYIASANVKVEIPGRTKGAPTTSQTSAVFEPGFTTQIGEQDPPSGASRLALLLAARSVPAAEAKDEQLFASNRDDAVLFVRGLIGLAVQQVIFVDAYFNFIDIREFTLFVSSSRCKIGVLTGRDEPKWQKSFFAHDPPKIHGSLMLANIEHINKIRADNHLSTIEIKVMGASSRSYHDRFLVIDDDVWHFGHSFNALGDGSVSVVTKLHRPEKVRVIIMEDFQRADTFENYWRTALEAIVQGRNSNLAKFGRYLHKVFSPLIRRVTSALRPKPKSERQS